MMHVFGSRPDRAERQPLLRRSLNLSKTTASTPRTLMRFPSSGLAINHPNDIHEQEADRVADKIMRMPSPEAASWNTTSSKGGLQRKCAECEKDEEQLQRKETGAASTAPPVVHEVLRS